MTVRYRRVLLALIAVFALSAVTAADASAASPEFKPVPTKKKFTSTSGSVVLAKATTAITCSKGTTAGEITSATTLGKVIVKFTGCEMKAGSQDCKVNSLTGKEGEIVTNALKGELGTVNIKEAASGVGLLLHAETGTKIATFADNACFAEATLNGDVAGEVATIGKKQLTNKLVFTGTGNRQNIKKIVVAGKEETPELEGWGGILSLTETDELTFEEALEVT